MLSGWVKPGGGPKGCIRLAARVAAGSAFDPGVANSRTKKAANIWFDLPDGVMPGPYSGSTRPDKTLDRISDPGFRLRLSAAPDQSSISLRLEGDLAAQLPPARQRLVGNLTEVAARQVIALVMLDLEVGMVEQVVELKPELEVEAFRDPSVLI
jgi:hypothetical protein